MLKDQAMSDYTQDSPDGKAPAIVLVAPQLGENIGAAARAMLNCGLTDLRLVSPRDGWPNAKAEAMSSGALAKMPPVQVFDSTAAAIADCSLVLATTARPRDMVKHVYTPRGAMDALRPRTAEGETTALLFGGERSGLHNDDVALAHGVVTVPLNPAFSSLNLGQAVLLLAYEWIMSGDKTAPAQLVTGDSPPAPHEKLEELMIRLENDLAERHFFRSDDMRPSMVRNIRSLLTRTNMTAQEVQTFHGMISALTGKKNPRRSGD